MKPFRRLLSLAALAAVGAALVEQLRQPAGERAWHGAVAGVVPYDFRPPTLERIKATWWDPEGSLVVGQVFGVGWSLNLGRLARLVGLA